MFQRNLLQPARNFLGIETPEKLDYPVNMNIVKKYFNVTDNPDEADYALGLHQQSE